MRLCCYTVWRYVWLRLSRWVQILWDDKLADDVSLFTLPCSLLLVMQSTSTSAAAAASSTSARHPTFITLVVGPLYLYRLSLSVTSLTGSESQLSTRYLSYWQCSTQTVRAKCVKLGDKPLIVSLTSSPSVGEPRTSRSSVFYKTA